jgi:hypothetical protein
MSDECQYCKLKAYERLRKKGYSAYQAIIAAQKTEKDLNDKKV